MRRRSIRRSFVIAGCLLVAVVNLPGASVAEGDTKSNTQEKQEKPQDPPIPPVEIPNRPDQPVPQQPQPQSPQPRSALNPDISVIGNNLGRLISVSGDNDRNRFQLGELEIGLQQAIFPGIRFDLFLAGAADEDFATHMEEGYATFSKVPGLPFGGILGRKRLNIGKLNPVHPHAWRFADTPAPIASLLGEEGVTGNGASFNYNFPARNLFANLEVGAFNLAEAEEGAEPGHGLGVAGSFPMARLWLSREFGKSSELEFGTSHGYGKAGNGDNIRLSSFDITYRRFPTAFKRMIAQAEWFQHRRDDRAGGTGGHARRGYYALLGYAPDQYYNYALRYDNTRFPWPLEGSERSISAIWTNRLSEATLFRIQFKHGDREGDSLLPAKKGFSEAWLQFIWGGGTHTHPIN